MIQQTSKSNVISDVTSSNFSIEVNESMFQLLTSKVYNDTIAAPIREWSTNALDACIEAGVVPNFDVHLPTTSEPFFSVRDYGTGLSEDDILGLFSTLGASTKRQSNAYNGTFGIGRMSGLAYATSFTVESYKDGTLYTYLISLKNNVPINVKLSEAPTTAANGLRLSLNVELKDINSFHTKARNIYRYFDTKPSLNVELDIELDTSEAISTEWFIDKKANYNNYILMSNVLYQIPDDSRIENKGFNHLIIKADNGTVTYNPGRESLSLDSATVDIINKRFEEIAKEYITAANAAITNAPTFMERLNTYSTTRKAAPYQIQDDILLPMNTTEAMFVDTYYGGSISNKSPNVILKYTSKYNEKTSDMSKCTLEIKNFMSYKFMLVDVSKGYLQAAQKAKYDLGNIILVIRPTGKKLEDFLVSVQADFFDVFGITDYLKASDYIDEKESTAIARTAAVYGSYMYSDGSFATSEELDVSNNYWYIPLSGTKSLLDNASQIREAYDLLPTPKPGLIGIPKKYMKAVESLANFVPVLDALQTELDKHTFLTISNDYYNNDLRFTELPATVPKDIEIYYEEQKKEKAIFKQKHYDYDQMMELSKYFKLNLNVYKCTDTLSTLYEKYPLFKYFNSKYYYNVSTEDKALFNYAMKLEYLNEQAQLYQINGQCSS